MRAIDLKDHGIPPNVTITTHPVSHVTRFSRDGKMVAALPEELQDPDHPVWGKIRDEFCCYEEVEVPWDAVLAEVALDVMSDMQKDIAKMIFLGTPVKQRL